MKFEQKYKNIKQLVQQELSKIEENLTSSISVRTPLNEKLIEFLNAPSKRIRSVLGILFIKANEEQISFEQIELLSAVEIVHNASLIHDDIIDQSTLRRGNKTISNQFGNKLGVISGDYLLSIAMEKIAKLNSPQILLIFSNTLKQMCIGEINQNFDRFKIGTIEEYIEKSKNKTAYLFEASIVCCALLGKKTYKLEEIKDFALNIGIAFQIRDDLNNLISHDNLKPAQTDIKDGIYTAPVIYSQDIQNYSSGIEKTQSLMNNYIEKAFSYAEKLPKNKFSDAIRDFLELLNNG